MKKENVYNKKRVWKRLGYGFFAKLNKQYMANNLDIRLCQDNAGVCW